LNIKLEIFEGPFDLLLHLIKKNEIDIYDIPISKITDEYLEYLYSQDYLDLDNASEFLVIAATLLEIKSKMLLPKRQINDTALIKGDEEDPRTELVEKLLEYQKYKEFSEVLREIELFQEQYLDPICPIEIHYDTKKIDSIDLTIDDLLNAFAKVLETNLNRGSKGEVFKIQREEVTIMDKKREILTLLGLKGRFVFQELFVNKGKIDLIVSFLAILELFRLGDITIFQEKSYGPIYISKRKK
jgi:segregation and condensation protein A